MRSMRLLVTSLAVAALLTPGCSRSSPSETPAGAWRHRLRVALFERTARDGTTWGREGLDPLLNGSTEYLLTPPSHAIALAEIDRFVAALDGGLALSPVERALIQRDLWAVHDWAMEPFA